MKLLFAALALLGASFDTTLREGLIALNGNDLNMAQARLEAATQLRPDSGEAWAALAQTYLKLAQPDVADKAAEKARRVADGNYRVLRALLLYYSGRGNPDAIVEIAPKTIQLSDSADLHNLLGKAYIAKGDGKNGAAQLREAIRLKPGEERYYFDLGQLFLHDEDFNTAASALEQGVKAIPASPQLNLALGVAYYGQRRFPEAIVRFLDTIRLAPEVRQPYVFLGKILDHAGERLPEIAARFAELRKANPNDATAQFLGAKVLLAQPGADTEEAEKLLRQSVAAKPDYWESHYELGALLAKKRSFAEAAAELERAIELNPKEAAPHYHLARVYDRLGEPEKAAAERAIHESLTGRSGVK